MAFTIVKTLTSLALIVVLTQGCELNQQGLEKIAMVCGPKAPALFMGIGETMSGMQSVRIDDIMCKNEEQTVDAMNCFMDEILKCLPVDMSSVRDFLPNRERIANMLHFTCQNKNVLDSNQNCMTMANMQAFMQCYQTLAMGMGQSADIGKSICKMVRSEEQCFAQNSGNCDKKLNEVFNGAIERLLPSSVCQGEPTNEKEQKSQQLNSFLGSLLIHGKPIGGDSLKFNSMQVQNRPYVIKN